MIKLGEIQKHQEKVAKKIHEFQKIDKLLDDYGIKFSELNNKISELETELIIWKKEKEDLEKDPDNSEEVKIWKEQIETIQNNINSNEIKLNEYQSNLDHIISKKEILREEINKIEINHVECLKNQLKEYIEKSEEEDFIETKQFLIYSLEQLKKLWKIQEKNSDLATFIKFFNSNNINLDLNLLNNVFTNKYPILPQIIPKFTNQLLKDRSIKTILDPWGSIGSPSFQIETNPDSQLSIVLEDNADKELIELLYENKNIKFKAKDYIEDLSQNNHFDLVIGHQQYNRNSKTSFEYENMELIDNKDYIELFKSLLKLKDGGIGFFILNQDFLLNRENNAVISNLEKFSLYIDSILNLPTELFDDSDKLFVIFTRKKPENLFIGELNYNSENILLENLKNRVSGKIPQHGALTNLISFYSFPYFLAKYESQEMVKNTNLDAFKFSDIIKFIRSSDNFSEKEKDFNYIFLPLDSSSKTVLSSQQFDKDPQNYLQIFLDEDLAFSDYMAHFLNTQLGIKIRDSFNICDLEIFQKLLCDAIIYLPDLENQIDVINVDSLISELFTRAENYKTNLWNLPQNVVKIRNEIENKEGSVDETIERWIETLPFPLASIIWASSTVPDHSVKVKYLIDFFEAFSEFNYVLMLSAISSDKNFFKREYERCKRNTKPANWYYKPTFGTWNYVGSCLAKTIRKLLENSEKRSRCLELFGNPDPEFLQRICNRKVYDLLLEVMNYRNQWDAHGPRVSPQEYENRYKIMEGALLRFYQIISNIFENSFLLMPSESLLRDGIHHYTVKRLVGTRGPFKSDRVETLSLMDSKKIYFLNKNQRKPVELLPLIIIKNEICYFYNSLYEHDHDEFGNLRYVSYHYSEKAEIPIIKDKLESIFYLLKSDFDYKY